MLAYLVDILIILGGIIIIIKLVSLYIHPAETIDASPTNAVVQSSTEVSFDKNNHLVKYISNGKQLPNSLLETYAKNCNIDINNATALKNLVTQNQQQAYFQPKISVNTTTSVSVTSKHSHISACNYLADFYNYYYQHN